MAFFDSEKYFNKDQIEWFKTRGARGLIGAFLMDFYHGKVFFDDLDKLLYNASRPTEITKEKADNFYKFNSKRLRTQEEKDKLRKGCDASVGIVDMPLGVDERKGPFIVDSASISGGFVIFKNENGVVHLDFAYNGMHRRVRIDGENAYFEVLNDEDVWTCVRTMNIHSKEKH